MPRTSLDIALGITHKYWEMQELTAYIMNAKNNYALEKQ